MKRYFVLFVVMALFAVPMAAQRLLLVVDYDTHKPIAQVSVGWAGHTLVTDSTGHVTLHGEGRSLLLSHTAYESMLMNLDDVKDGVVMLFPRNIGLDEVTVFGKGKADDGLDGLRNSLALSRQEAQLVGAQPLQGFNILGLLGYLIPKKWKKGYAAKKRQSRLQEQLDNY